MKISAKLAVCKEVLVRRMEARAAQAGAPRVLPLRLMVVTVVEDSRGARWGRMESAVSSLGVGGRRVNAVSDDMIADVAVRFVGKASALRFLRLGLYCDGCKVIKWEDFGGCLCNQGGLVRGACNETVTKICRVTGSN